MLYISTKKDLTLDIIKTSREIKNNKEESIINPKMKIKHNDDEIYDIIAEKVFYKDSDIIAKNISVLGKKLKLNAEKLEITENGNILKFSGNPYVIIDTSSNDFINNQK
ncbi:hypothetical protein N9C35_04345 [Flavobacteriaceae bacterium]|nr:hypothetical protein [Flavobacteriaceae bacterium]